MSDKSNEYDIRAAIVRHLLADGWKREHIRIEIPLCTASSGGRADILCIGDDYIGCIELKSGKDKFCRKALKEQCRPYKRAFDYCAVVADIEQHVRVTTEFYGCRGKRWDDNFDDVALVYHHNYWDSKASYFTTAVSHEKSMAVDKVTPHLFPPNYRKSRRTSVYDLAQVLWRDELVHLFGKGTKSGHEIKARDEYGLKEFRNSTL